MTKAIFIFIAVYVALVIAGILFENNGDDDDDTGMDFGW